jgi:uncharacterized protein (DUF3820 family)
MTGSFDWHLANWKLWCRRRDWMPMGHVSQLAALIRQAKQESQSAADAPVLVFDEPADAFNRLITMLPRRHLTVFLLNHLDKGILGQIVVYTRHADVKYRLAGVGRSTFYERAKEADSMIKRWME